MKTWIALSWLRRVAGRPEATALALACAFACASCGGSPGAGAGSGGTPGSASGGATGTGGGPTGGAPGTGGAGSGGAVGTGGGAGGALPGCLRDLFAACGTDSSCQGRGDRFCFASGAHAQGSWACSANGDPVDIVVTKPDGSPCFTLRVSNFRQGMACESGDYTWLNAAGDTVATRHVNSGGTTTMVSTTCTASAQTTSCQRTSPGCDTQPVYGTATCTLGDCP